VFGRSGHAYFETVGSYLHCLVARLVRSTRWPQYALGSVHCKTRSKNRVDGRRTSLFIVRELTDISAYSADFDGIWYWRIYSKSYWENLILVMSVLYNHCFACCSNRAVSHF
jgi:hypothetical protein